MSLECELTQLKVLHECIRGISCELALWIHKAVFTPNPFHSFKKQGERGLFEVTRFSFFFLSLQAKEDWVSLICSLYIWMSSAKSSSWPLDKGPGAETVAVPNFISVGAVNHGGGEAHALKIRACFPCWFVARRASPFPAPHKALAKPARLPEGGGLITSWYVWGPSIKLHNTHFK